MAATTTTTATTDDFSFPTTADASSTADAAGFDSPPLWRLSPAVSPSPSPIHPQSYSSPPPIHRRSFSHAAEYTKANHENFNQDGGQTNMDMLWEDFNEELSTTAVSRSKPRVYPVRGHRGLLLSPPRQISVNATKQGGSVDVGCGEARLRLSPKRRSISNNTRTTTVPSPMIGGGGSARLVNSSGASSSGKPGFVVLIKVLKRLFLLHHHHHHSGGGSRRASPPVKVKINRSTW
ncbi:unnamed protein product [Linum trigynum]|uniref:Uncharacterized protein n=1 Tax=Linum trigynum TaxID=586398 RepID=A0AAV2D277_9ROSI